MISNEGREPTKNHQLLYISDFNDLTLPKHFNESNSPTLPLMASSERLVSNPLVHADSNVSVSSDNGAHFVPYGRDHDEVDNANTLEDDVFSQITKLLSDMNEPLIPYAINCVTPVQSVSSKRQKLSSLKHLGPLEDGAADVANRTGSMQKKKPLNVKAAPFIPSLASQTQPQPHTHSTNLNPNTNPFVPIVPFMPPTMGMSAIGTPHLLMAVMQPHQQREPAVAPRINLNIPQGTGAAVMPLYSNTVQGSQQDPQSPNRSNTPNTQDRENSGGLSRDIPACGGCGLCSQRGNGSRSPVQPQQQQQRGWAMRANARNPRGTLAKHAVKQKQGGSHNHQGRTTNLQNTELLDIIKTNASLSRLLRDRMICTFMKHQNGSRYIQEKIQTSSSDVIDSILRHLIFEEDKIMDLSKDSFGNYVIQIFFKYPQQHRLLVDHLLTGNVYVLSRHFYGCRVIQAAFDHLPRHESKSLIAELEHESKNKRMEQMHRDGDHQEYNFGEENDQNSLIHQCIICLNANHVVQKIISLGLEIECIQFIIDCIAINVCYYSSHVFGCRIVQNVINYYGYRAKEMLKELIHKTNLLYLCQSQYGNYVIQQILKSHFFEDECREIKHQVVKNVFENVVHLSKNKYGSNVVENCLDLANDQQRNVVLDAIINNTSKQFLCEMVKHKYANYVIQRLLNNCNVRQQQRLLNAIERNVSNSMHSRVSNNVMDKIKKLRQQIRFEPY